MPAFLTPADAVLRELALELARGDLSQYAAFLRERGGFRAYSAGNQRRIARQRPDATLVAGRAAWRASGHQIKLGERPIWIWARSEERWIEAPVFDLAQVEPAPARIGPPRVIDDVTLYRRLAGAMEMRGVRVEKKPQVVNEYDFRSYLGLFRHIPEWEDPEIEILASLDDAKAATILIHECAHALLFDEALSLGPGSKAFRVFYNYGWLTELHADATTIVVSALLGRGEERRRRDLLLKKGFAAQDLGGMLPEVKQCAEQIVALLGAPEAEASSTHASTASAIGASV